MSEKATQIYIDKKEIKCLYRKCAFIYDESHYIFSHVLLECLTENRNLCRYVDMKCTIQSR